VRVSNLLLAERDRIREREIHRRMNDNVRHRTYKALRFARYCRVECCRPVLRQCYVE
jgi:hypothetical protein